MYSESEKKCFSVCKGNDNLNPFSLSIKVNDRNHIERNCAASCDNTENYFKYYNENDYICKDSCDLLIEEDTNRYTDKCNDEHYKFQYDHKCLVQCLEGNKRYLRSNYKCIDKCPDPTIFLP